jgi:phosphatidylserine/phosphatidylglycerophosphate/cardiolipin synthase-like enzyme
MEIKTLIENEYLPAIMAAIKNTKETLLMIIYVAKINKNRKQDEVKLLFDEAISLNKKNITVKILFNSIEKNSIVSRANKGSFDYLKTNGVPVRYTPDGRITHCKLILIDDNVSIFGSHNLSNTALHKSREISILIKDEMTNFNLKEYFNKNFKEAKE